MNEHFKLNKPWHAHLKTVGVLMNSNYKNCYLDCCHENEADSTVPLRKSRERQRAHRPLLLISCYHPQFFSLLLRASPVRTGIKLTALQFFSCFVGLGYCVHMLPTRIWALRWRTSADTSTATWGTCTLLLMTHPWWEWRSSGYAHSKGVQRHMAVVPHSHWQNTMKQKMFLGVESAGICFCL